APKINSQCCARLTSFKISQRARRALALRTCEGSFGTLSLTIQQKSNARINAAANNEPSIQSRE
ncbi:MAG TPA: hypothetical protein VFQ47_01410, partial [Nitrososphaera sp.]|nr:hypothetical protein [Nitrososphaera sp.]